LGGQGDILAVNADDDEGFGEPTFDELVRWIREDLDARPGGRRDDSPVAAPSSVDRSPAAGPGIALVVAADASRPELGDLLAALRRHGVATERIELATDAQDFDAVLRSYLCFYDLDLSRFDGVISTAAPAIAVRHRNHVCWLADTTRGVDDGAAGADREAQRGIIVRLDSAALSRPSVKAVFAAGPDSRAWLSAVGHLGEEILAPSGGCDPICERLLGALGCRVGSR
jgi:hypothetical protein